MESCRTTKALLMSSVPTNYAIESSKENLHSWDFIGSFFSNAICIALHAISLVKITKKCLQMLECNHCFPSFSLN
uniref:Uncharacterized protein n=1 Tax=Arundo donax TaxID=35708 RepID=A0A0A9HC46_ARUDO